MANSVLLAPSPAGEQPAYNFMYYLKGAAAGGICCSITHGALTPVDVVKTRVQLDPVKVRTQSRPTVLILQNEKEMSLLHRSTRALASPTTHVDSNRSTGHIHSHPC